MVGKVFEGDSNLTEMWYGTQYSISKLSQDLIQGWKDAGLHDKFYLPDVNEFIPINFDLVTRDSEPSSVPIILRDSKMTRLWYRQDDQFKLPKACINVQFTRLVLIIIFNKVTSLSCQRLASMTSLQGWC